MKTPRNQGQRFLNFCWCFDDERTEHAAVEEKGTTVCHSVLWQWLTDLPPKGLSLGRHRAVDDMAVTSMRLDTRYVTRGVFLRFDRSLGAHF